MQPVLVGQLGARPRRACRHTAGGANLRTLDGVSDLSRAAGDPAAQRQRRSLAAPLAADCGLGFSWPRLFPDRGLYRVALHDRDQCGANERRCAALYHRDFVAARRRDGHAAPAVWHGSVVLRHHRHHQPRHLRPAAAPTIQRRRPGHSPGDAGVGFLLRAAAPRAQVARYVGPALRRQYRGPDSRRAGACGRADVFWFAAADALGRLRRALYRNFRVVSRVYLLEQRYRIGRRQPPASPRIYCRLSPPFWRCSRLARRCTPITSSVSPSCCSASGWPRAPGASPSWRRWIRSPFRLFRNRRRPAFRARRRHPLRPR